ncbi:MAG: hypothetical protein ABIR91_04810, partial [Candidatus Saccharimonadales bacterium]
SPPPKLDVVTPPASTPIQAASPTDTPPPASAQKQTDTTSSAGVDASTKTAVTNDVASVATTGAASVMNNTTAQNAASGDALAQATIVNTVNSMMASPQNKQIATFNSDILGDVTGDIILQPMMLKAMLEADQGSTDATVKTTNQLANTVDLSAMSGAALVEGNTQAGSAKSGSAHTVADVVNIINSMVAADQSFIGTINIFGNLNGDILIAPDFIAQLLASNDDHGSSKNAPTTVNAVDTQSIINNVSLAAQSGKAAVTGNTSGGQALTGDAKTNVVLFNLSGHEIVANNSLLVFVNVLGKWVGVIVDAPAGATAAAIGNGVTTNTVATPDLVVRTVNDTQITNTIVLQSQSGDALVAHNTQAGDALSGDATASASIANISNSQFGLSGWFGVLFINVFGSWMGSFGVDTAYGTVTAAHNHATGPVTFISRTPHAAGPSLPASKVTLITPTAPIQNQSMISRPSTVPATATTASGAHHPVQSEQRSDSTTFPSYDYRLLIATAGLAVMGVSYVGLRRLLRIV